MTLDERQLSFNEPGWLFEIKFDGYRLMAEFGDGKARLKTRRGADATKWFPEITDNLAEMLGGPYIVDGEVCVLDDLGRSDFERLQDRARRRRWYTGADPVVFCVFDLLVDRGKDITRMPLIERKARLLELFTPSLPNVLFVSHFDGEGEGEMLFKQAVLGLKLEGLVAKRASSVYVPGARSSDWVKIKRKGAVSPERFKR